MPFLESSSFWNFLEEQIWLLQCSNALSQFILADSSHPSNACKIEKLILHLSNRGLLLLQSLDYLCEQLFLRGTE